MTQFTKSEENYIDHKEFLLIAIGMTHSIDSWGITLRSSNPSIDTLTCLLDDNVFPPYASHKFLRNDIIKIRDYLNQYLERTFSKHE